MPDHDVYDNPLISRYASREMAERWGPRRKIGLWRRLWLALAETQAELGLTDADRSGPRISPEQLDDLRRELDTMDWQAAAGHEKRLRHDVMAHIHTFGEAAPAARDILHLGATSCFVTDNADLILIRESLAHVRDQLVDVIQALAEFAREWRDLPTLGYTHFQPAQLTTVGKRACLWCYDFLLDLDAIDRMIAELPFRGAKGTTGTQASFLELFHGDADKVRELDRRLAVKFGFDQVVPVCGQTYTRKFDRTVLGLLTGVAESAHKFGTDLRLLAHEREIEEPFESEQIGSSAMAYKRNPMRAERICSLARFAMGLEPMAAQTSATQWLERTLDDSAARRLYLPQAFLAADAILRLVRNVAGGLIVRPAMIRRHVREQLPFMATEAILMAAVAAGGDRQELHERIRRHSMAFAEEEKSGIDGVPLIERLQSDPAFAAVNWDTILAPERHTGRAAGQVDEFLETTVRPTLARFVDTKTRSAELQV